MSKEVVTTDTRKRKDKYNAKVARFRPVKNLLLWLSGVVSGLILLVIALVVLPVGTILGIAGMEASDTIGEENGKKSIYGDCNGDFEVGNRIYAGGRRTFRGSKGNSSRGSDSGEY